MLPIPNPEVVFKPVNDGAVLLHSATEVYFGLNSVGARIWELLQTAGATLDDVSAALHTQYPGVDLATLRSDVAELVAELVRHGLLVNGGAQAPRTAGVSAPAA